MGCSTSKNLQISNIYTGRYIYDVNESYNGVERILTSSAVDIKIIKDKSSRISKTCELYIRLFEKYVSGRSK